MINNRINHFPNLGVNQHATSEITPQGKIERSATHSSGQKEPLPVTPFTPERRKDLLRKTPSSVKLLINIKDHENNLLDEVLHLVRALNSDASPQVGWWDRDEQLKNNNLALLNQKINDLINEGHPKPLLMTLKFLSDYPFGEINTFFTKTLRALQNSIPHIVGETYIREDNEDPARGQIVTPQSVQKLFTFFEQHFNIPKGLLTCQKLSVLPSLVNQMVKDMREGEFKGWAVSNDISDFDLHMVPFFSIVQNGKVNVFIFDSIGHTSGEKFFPELEDISCGFRELLMRNPNLQEWQDKVAIYSYAQRRQNDVRGCWAFVVQDLRDLVEMHLDPQAHSIVDFYSPEMQRLDSPTSSMGSICTNAEEMLCLSSPNSPPLRKDITPYLQPNNAIELYEVNSLPPAMMKVTQSLSKINRYCQESRILLEETAFKPHSAMRPSPNGEMIPVLQNLPNLESIISQNTIFNSDGNKQQNVYAGRMRFTYIVYLITSLWEEQSKLK